MKTKRIISIIVAVTAVSVMTSCSKKEEQDVVDSVSSTVINSSSSSTNDKNTVGTESSTVSSSTSSTSTLSTSSYVTSSESTSNVVSSTATSSTSSYVTSSETTSNVVSSTTTSSSIASNNSIPVESNTISSSSIKEDNTPKPAEQEWTEKEYIADLYICKNNVKSRVKPTENSDAIKEYNKNDIVHVIALINDNYYKLEDGSFIYDEFLSVKKIELPNNTNNNTSNSNNGNNNNNNLIPLTRPVPNNASEETKSKLQKNVFRELWNLNIGDTTSTGYKIIGKTPEGFGYIGVEEDSEETGYYIAYYDDNGNPCYVCDEVQNQKYWDSLNFTVKH